MGHRNAAATKRHGAWRLGEAVAKRLYPRAKSCGGVFDVDFILPDGSFLEAKAARLFGRFVFTPTQLEWIAESRSVRFVLVAYRDVPGYAAAAVADAPCAAIGQALREHGKEHNGEGAWAQVTPVLRSLLAQKSRVDLVPRLDLRVGAERHCLVMVPILTVGERSAWRDERTWRARRGDVRSASETSGTAPF